MGKQRTIRGAVHRALAAGAAATFAYAPSLSVAQEDDVAVQDRITVTGTRIPRAGTETSSPVTILTRQDIDASGQISVSEVLRRLPQNTFGSRRERSGAANGGEGVAAVNLRGLGSARTLVLLDGRRIAGAPAFAGSFTNLNLIPFAAVERIEVLRDGASAIYGSDAIGGVVNIILRKDYEGVHLSLGVGRPTQAGGGDEDVASLVGGLSSSSGNITYGIDYSSKSMLYNADRTYSSVAFLSVFGFPGSYFANAADLSPNGPGGNRFLATLADQRCPSLANPLSSLQDATDFYQNTPDTVFPASVAVTWFTGPRCVYNTSDVDAFEARIRRQSLFVNSNFEVTDDTDFFARAITANNESFGRYAPAEAFGNTFPGWLPTMAASNPNNPTQGTQFTFPDLDPNFNELSTSSTYTGPFDISFFYRNVPGGPRDTFVTDQLLDLVAGLKGTMDWADGADWEIALQHSRVKTDTTSTGLASGTLLQDSIDSGAFDIFGVNGPTSSTIAQSFAIDAFTDNETTLVGGDATINFDWGGLPGGPVSWAWGVEYQDSEFVQNNDMQTNFDATVGGRGGEDISGARAVFSAFGEALIPILNNLEIDVALRYDDYNDFGSTTNPKFGVAYQPTNTLLLRGTYGEGFRAPELNRLYGRQFDSFEFERDVRTCNNLGDSNQDGIPDHMQEPSVFPPGHPCGSVQFQTINGANPDLKAETSEGWTTGFIWSPTTDLSMGIDYYNIEINNEAEVPSSRVILEGEAVDNPFFSSLVSRDPSGRLRQVILIWQNLARRKTEGLDIEASLNFGFDRLGDFNASASFAHVLDYESGFDFFDPVERFPTDLQADTRGTIGLGWQRGDYGGQLNIHYLSTVSDNFSLHLSSWTTYDLQLTWDTPWNGKVSLGARNLTNEDPPVTQRGLDVVWAPQFHDVYGRIPYIRYEQDL